MAALLYMIFLTCLVPLHFCAALIRWQMSEQRFLVLYVQMVWSSGRDWVDKKTVGSHAAMTASSVAVQEERWGGQVGGGAGATVYTASVSAARPASDFTARVIPHFEGVAMPLEEARILWCH